MCQMWVQKTFRMIPLLSLYILHLHTKVDVDFSNTVYDNLNVFNDQCIHKLFHISITIVLYPITMLVCIVNKLFQFLIYPWLYIHT